ncbi:nesprin-4 isoform X2 [Rhinatrema bivittatum]|uniref:nesprin-4 isoform X2 n=1 Tax=Rhinatrema bivittatum TaxID=194408 RepID=UPI0011273FC4|nr:nesprin-4 isoform X2 [Rhinatrema bivittatum]
MQHVHSFCGETHQEAWQLWKAFFDTLSRYKDWLQGAEQMAACPNSSHVLYAEAKEELKKFEVLHRKVQERLGQLESLNRQYWRLVTKGPPVDSNANGTGLKAKLRAVVQDSNQRWESLQKQVTAVYKRLKYFVGQREEFESERENIKLWLTEMDLRLTDVQHFSNGGTLKKMKELQAFQEHVQSSAEQMDWLLVFGERLIQRSEPQDAERLEEELQEISCYCQEVFNRVCHFRRRLISTRLVFEDDWLSDRESDLDSDCFSDVLEKDEENEERKWGESALHLHTSLWGRAQHRHPKDPRLCAAPARSGSEDLEWDPSVDVGESTSHDEEDSSYFSMVTGKSGVWPWEEAAQQRSSRSSAHTRSRASAEIELQVSLDSMENCDETPDFGTWTSNREDSFCPLGPKDSHRNEPTQNIPDRLMTKNGSYCQAEPLTSDQNWIESWLGQMQSEQLGEAPGSPLGIPQGSMQLVSSCPLSSEDTQSVTVQPKAEGSNGYWCRRNGQYPKQLIPASRAKQKLDRQWPSCSAQEVTITIEERDDSVSLLLTEEEPLPPKSQLVLWGRTLDPVSVLLVLLLLALLLLFSGETPCSKANHYAWSRHLMLHYVNGPPPT